MRVVATAIGILIVLAGVLYWWWSGREDDSAVPMTAPASTGAPADDVAADDAAATLAADAAAPQPLTLPALDESDPFVREQVGALSERLADWLAQEDLVRRFAVVLDNAARGEIPVRQIAFLAPASKYPVRTEGERTFVDPAGYGRFDPFVDTVLSVPPEQAAALLRTLAPLLREALAELGVARPDPLAAVRAAIRQALLTPEVPAAIELVQPKVLYKYADPALEALPPLQKQLLRMGPANLERVKGHLREVLGYL
jgi:hypothetical protein